MTSEALFKCDLITFFKKKYNLEKATSLENERFLGLFFIIKAEFDTLVPQLFFFHELTLFLLYCNNYYLFIFQFIFSFDTVSFFRCFVDVSKLVQYSINALNFCFKSFCSLCLAFKLSNKLLSNFLDGIVTFFFCFVFFFCLSIFFFFYKESESLFWDIQIVYMLPWLSPTPAFLTLPGSSAMLVFYFFVSN